MHFLYHILPFCLINMSIQPNLFNIHFFSINFQLIFYRFRIICNIININLCQLNLHCFLAGTFLLKMIIVVICFPQKKVWHSSTNHVNILKKCSFTILFCNVESLFYFFPILFDILLLRRHVLPKTF